MANEQTTVTKLKPIKVLNDYVAVMRDINLPEGVFLDEAQAQKISNEGIVVGIGAALLTANPQIELGDVVVFARKVYLELTPSTGCYTEKTIAIIKMSDLLVAREKSDKYVVGH